MNASNCSYSCEDEYMYEYCLTSAQYYLHYIGGLIY